MVFEKFDPGECEDCGEEKCVHRVTCCKCGLKICAHCWGHAHGFAAQEDKTLGPAIAEIEAEWNASEKAWNAQEQVRKRGEKFLRDIERLKLPKFRPPWLVVQQREAYPVEVWECNSLEEAEALYAEKSPNWTETYICLVVKGPIT